MPASPRFATSSDRTAIAYEVIGHGPPVILVVGAFNDRSTGAALARALAGDFTVFIYDRRGRGDSGDAAIYAIAREIEDLGAIIDAAGGHAAVLGFSSGAVLALRAAAAGLPIDRLVVFGAPLIVDDARPPLAHDLADRVRTLVESGRRGEAVELFQREAIAMPPDIVARMRDAPFRPHLEALAHTLFNDLTILTAQPDPLELALDISAPTLVLDGAAGPPWIGRAARELAVLISDATHLSVPGLTQDLTTELIVPPVSTFLKSR